jgi:hypothetical protein
MDSDSSDLSKLVQAKAKESGISSKDAKKAIKKLRKGGGGIMAQVSSQLHGQFMGMNPNMTPRDKLRAKMNKMKNGRISKTAKSANYEKERVDVLKRKEEATVKEEEKKKEVAQAKRNHKKKLKQLSKQLGTITQELYNTCMQRLQNNEYTDPSLRNRDKNITEVYSTQQAFTDKINMDALDDI